MCSILRAEANRKIDKITRSCIDIQNHPEDLEEIVQKLTQAINKLRSDTEAKILKYKEEFRKKFGNMEEYRQRVLQKVKDAQDEKDVLRKTIDMYSDIKLIKENNRLDGQIEGLHNKVLNIRGSEPIELEELEPEGKFMPFQTHKFTIPRAVLVSEEYEMYDNTFSVSVSDDLIGLFKSFNITLKPNDHAPMVFEYDICLIKGNNF